MRCACEKTPALYSREASNLIEMELKFLVRAGVELALLVSLTKAANFVLNVLSNCFVVSTKPLLATNATDSVLEEAIASLRFRIFNIEPRAGRIKKQIAKYSSKKPTKTQNN